MQSDIATGALDDTKCSRALDSLRSTESSLINANKRHLFSFISSGMLAVYWNGKDSF